MAKTAEEGSTLWASRRLAVSREVATDPYDTVYMAREGRMRVSVYRKSL